ncbi:hypothetical protein BHM03_00030165 [Ensete ventricosum]|nr:hypothetical protein BHM03_00030165 [Ensete ventricosum]
MMKKSLIGGEPVDAKAGPGGIYRGDESQASSKARWWAIVPIAMVGRRENDVSSAAAGPSPPPGGAYEFANVAATELSWPHPPVGSNNGDLLGVNSAGVDAFGLSAGDGVEGQRGSKLLYFISGTFFYLRFRRSVTCFGTPVTPSHQFPDGDQLNLTKRARSLLLTERPLSSPASLSGRGRLEEAVFVTLTIYHVGPECFCDVVKPPSPPSCRWFRWARHPPPSESRTHTSSSPPIRTSTPANPRLKRASATSSTAPSSHQQGVLPYEAVSSSSTTAASAPTSTGLLCSFIHKTYRGSIPSLKEFSGTMLLLGPTLPQSPCHKHLFLLPSSPPSALSASLPLLLLTLQQPPLAVTTLSTCECHLCFSSLKAATFRQRCSATVNLHSLLSKLSLESSTQSKKMVKQYLDRNMHFLTRRAHASEDSSCFKSLAASSSYKSLPF